MEEENLPTFLLNAYRQTFPLLCVVGAFQALSSLVPPLLQPHFTQLCLCRKSSSTLKTLLSFRTFHCSARSSPEGTALFYSAKRYP